MNGLVYLKVKIKSLAVEARIIKLEESRAKARGSTVLLQGLNYHRKFAVRPEARATQIAYAYLRGRPYASVEPHTEKPIPEGKIKAMCERYGGGKFDTKKFAEWVEGEQLAIPIVAE